MFTKRILSIVAVAVLAFSLVQTAHADYMSYKGMGLRRYVYIKGRYSLAEKNFNSYAGQMKYLYQGEDYLAYCVDVSARAGSAEVTEAPYTSLRNGEMIAYLFGTNAAVVSTGQEAAGLQVAIWELLYENDDTLDFNLDTGNFWTSTGKVVDDANGFLDDMRLNMPDNYTPMFDLTVLQTPCKQDMIIGGQAPVIPEPATAAILAIGGLVLLKRRRGRITNACQDDTP